MIAVPAGVEPQGARHVLSPVWRALGVGFGGEREREGERERQEAHPPHKRSRVEEGWGIDGRGGGQVTAAPASFNTWFRRVTSSFRCPMYFSAARLPFRIQASGLRVQG